jgi:hypothetical protein
MGLLLLFLSVCNLIKAFGQFERIWKLRGEGVYARCYDVRDNTIDWLKILNSMRLSATLYIPGLPASVVPVLSAVLIFFLIFGLNFRKVFPLFSLLSWGVAITIITPIFVQMIGFNIAHALKVRELEKKIGKRIRPKLGQQ